MRIVEKIEKCSECGKRIDCLPHNFLGHCDFAIFGETEDWEIHDTLFVIIHMGKYIIEVHRDELFDMMEGFFENWNMHESATALVELRKLAGQELEGMK